MTPYFYYRKCTNFFNAESPTVTTTLTPPRSCLTIGTSPFFTYIKIFVAYKDPASNPTYNKVLKMDDLITTYNSNPSYLDMRTINSIISSLPQSVWSNESILFKGKEWFNFKKLI